MSELPRIAVLMAAYNGAEYIAEQIRTILESNGVDVHIFLSDDGSTDATVAIAQATAGDRLTLLEHKPAGTAAQNFIRLILDTDWQGFDYVSLTDQDDIWQANKLERAVQVINEQHCAGYSSDVTAFWKDGRQKYLRKSQKQRRLDHIFESAGPGNTYVFPVHEADFLRQQLQNMSPEDLSTVFFHDWFFYAIIRGAGKTWYIDHFSGLLYRQHGENVLGASSGLTARMSRLRSTLQAPYFNQAALIARHIGANNLVMDALNRPGILHPWRLLTQLFEMRRNPGDAIILFFLLCLMSLKSGQV